MPERLNPATLAGGIVVILLGVWILLNDADVLGLSFEALAPALAAGAGVILLVSGLTRRE